MIRIIRNIFRTGKKSRKSNRKNTSQTVKRLQVVCMREAISHEMMCGQRMNGKTMADFMLN